MKSITSKTESKLTTSREGEARLQAIVEWSQTQEQVQLAISETLHGGMYARSCVIPAGLLVTGVRVKADSILVLSGRGIIYDGDNKTPFEGHTVLTGLRGRRCAVYTLDEVNCTTLISTHATDLKHAVEDYTDEVTLLQSANHLGD